MTHLSRALNTEAGRAAFMTYAQDSVRMRIRKRWEERRRETDAPSSIRVQNSKGFLIPLSSPRRERWVEIAAGGDGSQTEYDMGTALLNARRRRIEGSVYRSEMFLARY